MKIIPDNSVEEYYPNKLTKWTAWKGHIPFAIRLVELLAPEKLVELGVYYGDSYFAFCQAVKKFNLPTQCIGIDTWEGDTLTSKYNSAEVKEEVFSYNTQNYAEFSSLLSKNFDDAALEFTDNSIDILHIDGGHSYEEASHDFTTWLPKMKKNGIILFHDIEVRTFGFGVYKLWEEVTHEYPAFEFTHSCGLGVLSVNKRGRKELKELFGDPSKVQSDIRHYFSIAGSNLRVV